MFNLNKKFENLKILKSNDIISNILNILIKVEGGPK